jgi:two-component system cell cycle response regulator
MHVLTQFQLDHAYLITPDKVVSGIYPKEKIPNDPLLTSIGKALLPPQYVVYTAQELPKLQIGFVPGLEQLIIIPIRAQQKTSYLLAVPIYNNLSTAHLDHETIRTLAEQMSLLLENMALEKLSIFDDLTKLYNARFFREKLDEYTNNYKQLSLILMDIDFFKKVNDTYGHLAGDMVLQNMGAVLKSTLIKDGVVARVGGEEFAILVPNQDQEGVLKFAESIANKIRALSMPYEDKVLKITSSFGISIWDPSKMVVREFYKAADGALYQSKKDGRDRITFYKAS